jgi:hypothetical protein
MVSSGRLEGLVFYVSREDEEHTGLYEYDIKSGERTRVGDIPVNIKRAVISADGKRFFYYAPLPDSRACGLVAMSRRNTGSVFKKSHTISGEELPGAVMNMVYDDWRGALLLFLEDGTRYVTFGSFGYRFVRTGPLPGRTVALSKDYAFFIEEVKGEEFLTRRTRNEGFIGKRDLLSRVPERSVYVLILNGENGALISTFGQGPDRRHSVYRISFNGGFDDEMEPRFILKPYERISAVQSLAGGVVVIEDQAKELGGYRPLEPGKYTRVVSVFDIKSLTREVLFEYRYDRYKFSAGIDATCIGWATTKPKSSEEWSDKGVTNVMYLGF